MVDGNVDAKGTRKVAEAYLNTSIPRKARSSPPSTTTGRRSRTSCRPTELQELPELKLVTIDDPIFGGWAKAQPDHFGDGGIFDQIYKPAQ